jgi:hypothetical protein
VHPSLETAKVVCNSLLHTLKYTFLVLNEFASLLIQILLLHLELLVECGNVDFKLLALQETIFNGCGVC